MALIGVLPDYPQFSFDGGARVDYSYEAGTGTGRFKFENAEPIFFQASQSSNPVNVLPPRSFTLEFTTDGAGNLVGGVAGADMVLVGSIDVDGDTLVDYSGVLLTGEIKKFGFEENPTPGGPDTDTFDFLITPDASSALYPLLGGRDIGIRVAAEPDTPTFTGSFQTNFRTIGKGSLGAFSLGSLGDKVFYDRNVNGVQDPGEEGVEGATVELLDAGGAVLATQVTDAHGEYLFTDLALGVYSVRFSTNGKGVLTYPDEGSNDSLDSDAVPNSARTVGTSAAVFVQPNEANLSVDAGIIPYAAISGFVYVDADNDGVKQVGETPLPGVQLELTGTDMFGKPVTRTTATLVDGSYLFDGLVPSNAAGYSVREVAQPAGYLDGQETADNATPLSGSVGTDLIAGLVLLPGQVDPDNNFGELLPASLSGFVYHDADNDGVLDAGEARIVGASVKLTGTNDLGAAVSSTLMTAADGSYFFGGLRPGTYAIEETQPEGYLDGKDTIGTPGGSTSDDQFSNIVLGAGVAGVNNNFGEILAASLAGFVYVDADNDGVFDSGESPIENVTITLTGTNDLNQSVSLVATTDATGAYKFDGLRPGTYTLEEEQPANFDDGKDTIGTPGGSTSNDQFGNIVLGAGVAGVNNNFGERLKLAPATAAISGFVYVDADNDGVFDSGEKPIKNVTVTLTGTDDLGQSVLLVRQTQSNGSYSFTGLRPGTYKVTESQPAAYFDGKDTAGSLGGTTTTNDVIASIVLPAGQLSVANNFGERLASLSGTTYKDQSGNGLTADDLPYKLGSVTVRLYRESNNQPGQQGSDTLVQTVQTNSATGFYKFEDLGPGTYYAVESTPSGYLRTEPALTGTYTVTAAQPQEYPNNDFAYYYNCGCASSVKNITYVINGSNTVTDLRGKTDQGDLVTVNFTVWGNRPVELSFVTYTAPSAWFDANEASGQVVFDVQTGTFAPGTHSMTVQIPNSNYQIDFVCGKVIDVLGPAGSNRFYTPQNRLISADNDGKNAVRRDGASLSGTVYFDANASGGLNAGDTRLGLVQVVLTGRTTAGNKSVTLTRYTKPDGTYKFDNLEPGTYTVTESQPSGYLDGGESIGKVNGVARGSLSGTDAIAGIALGAGQSGVDYNFGETKAGSLSGKVFQDDDKDGRLDSGEAGIAGVTITLTGTDVFGRSVSRTTTTSSDGGYRFGDLAPGTYSVSEAQPAGFDDGIDSIGSLGGVKPSGSNDLITQIALDLQASGTGYNFAEIRRASAPSGIACDTTATIDYWKSYSGQCLLGQVRGDKLGDWMAETFPKLFGSQSKYNLAGKSGSQIASIFKNTIYCLSSTRSEAEVWATAFNVFFTTKSLGGSTSGNPFDVSNGGLGSMSINVGSDGWAVCVSNNSNRTVLDLLKAANDVADGSRWASLTFSGSSRRNDIEDLFSKINKAGRI